MKLWFQVMETRVSSVWNQSFKRLKLLETTDNDSLPLHSKDKGDNKKAFIGYYHPIITIYYHPLSIRNQGVKLQK